MRRCQRGTPRNHAPANLASRVLTHRSFPGFDRHQGHVESGGGGRRSRRVTREAPAICYDEPFRTPTPTPWIPRELVEPPRLPATPGGRVAPRTALLLNPF